MFENSRFKQIENGLLHYVALEERPELVFSSDVDPLDTKDDQKEIKFSEDIQVDSNKLETLLHHNEEMPKKTKQMACPFCIIYTANSRKSITIHLKSHLSGNQTIDCQQCGKQFSDAHMFVTHNLNHKPKKFSCSFCSKSFPCKAVLIDHQHLHENVQQFLCSVCGKRYKMKKSLKQHLRLHHQSHKYNCQQCSFTSYTQCDLRKHLRTHLKEKPYLCDSCGVRFTQSSHLSSHKKTHICNRLGTWERPHFCDVCFRSFTKRSDLHRHKLIHSSEFPYLCHVCGKGFRQSGHIQNHLKTCNLQSEPVP